MSQPHANLRATIALIILGACSTAFGADTSKPGGYISGKIVGVTEGFDNWVLATPRSQVPVAQTEEEEFPAGFCGLDQDGNFKTGPLPEGSYDLTVCTDDKNVMSILAWDPGVTFNGPLRAPSTEEWNDIVKQLAVFEETTYAGDSERHLATLAPSFRIFDCLGRLEMTRAAYEKRVKEGMRLLPKSLREEWSVKRIWVDRQAEWTCAVVHVRTYNEDKIIGMGDRLRVLHKINGCWMLETVRMGIRQYKEVSSAGEFRENAVEHMVDGPLVGVVVKNGEETRIPPIVLRRVGGGSLRGTAGEAADTTASPSPFRRPKELTLECGKDASGNGVNMKLVLVPAGEFMMGGDEPPEQVARKCGHMEMKAEEFQNEQPQHRVRITKPFFMGVYPVTQAQYTAVMGVNRSEWKGRNNPVETVSWNDAVEFCRRLSGKSGMAVRLPTEAEWEYACRAGTTTPFNTGETISTDEANYGGFSTYGTGRQGEERGRTVPVGSFTANGFGLYDMHGNVFEWCQDWYDAEYYKNSPTDDPQGPETGTERVWRSGSWASCPGICRSAARYRGHPGHQGPLVGFRVVCAPKP